MSSGGSSLGTLSVVCLHTTSIDWDDTERHTRPVVVFPHLVRGDFDYEQDERAQ